MILRVYSFYLGARSLFPKNGPPLSICFAPASFLASTNNAYSWQMATFGSWPRLHRMTARAGRRSQYASIEIGSQRLRTLFDKHGAIVLWQRRFIIAIIQYHAATAQSRLRSDNQSYRPNFVLYAGSDGRQQRKVWCELPAICRFAGTFQEP